MTLTVAAAVIHHRRYPEVLETLRSLVRAGIPAQSLVVIDNSEDDQTARGLRRTSDGWVVHTMANRGYGAAANVALSLCAEADLLLIATHETLIDGSSLEALALALTSDPTIAAAGPDTLVTDNGRVWSRGGMLTKHLRLPKHLVGKCPPSHGATHIVDWLDGACVLYRVNALAKYPFREDFFLYFEETELHARLRRAGWGVVTVTGATAYQRSGGMPAFWGSRNFVLFQQAHGSRLSRLVAPMYFMLRTVGVSLVNRKWVEALAAPRGLYAGYRDARKVSR